MDSVNSTTFIKRPPYMTDVQELFLYTKELLSGRIFLGSYLEKRYVTVLKDYRDVVYVNCEESDLKLDLDKIRKKWLGMKELKWVGITGPDEFGFPKAHCLWVKLTNLPIGQYWFQIKHVKLVDLEIVFQLKCIRTSQAPESSKNICKVNTNNAGASTSNTVLSELDPQKALLTLQEKCAEAVETIGPLLTLRNMTVVLKVGFALTIALIMGMISLIGHLGEYILKLIREFTLLVNAFTPIIIQLIDLLSKIIGAFFILVASMFRTDNRPVNVEPYRRQVLYFTPKSDVRVSSQPHVDWKERNRVLRQELFSNS